jgi:hypothetical protein
VPHQELALGSSHRHIIRTLGNTLNGPEDLGHALGLVGELNE